MENIPPTLHVFSTLEVLPRELLFMLFGYATTSLPKIRKASQNFKALVGEYAIWKPTIKLINKVEIREGDEHTLIFSVKGSPNLFDTRILRNPPPGLLSRIIRSINHELGLTQYAFMFKACKYQIKLAYFLNCMGTRIGEATFTGTFERIFQIKAIVNGKEFDTLRFSFSFEDQMQNHILYLVKTCKVNHVYFRSSTRTIPDQFLLNLSLFVQSISIVMGLVNIDWCTILVEMFSRKLDKMRIKSDYYFSSNAVNILITKLSTLNKNIWFEADCAQFSTECSFFRNDHVVECKNISNVGLLSVKHSSRVTESF